MTAVQTKSAIVSYSRLPSPVGLLHIASIKGAIVYIGFGDTQPREEMETYLQRYTGSYELVEDDGANEAVHSQLLKYFSGSLRKFSVRSHLFGTDFQLQVWTAIRSIPYGSTVTYKYIANAIGNPDGMRAVGQATGRNPIPIIIPCHRVIGESGALTGFGGGIENKKKLLRLEGSLLV
jgi:methylated-DNA-[protein]-cysteine S-methyltransferase